jgi:hypothetical protein
VNPLGVRLRTIRQQLKLTLREVENEVSTLPGNGAKNTIKSPPVGWFAWSGRNMNLLSTN